MTSVWEAFGTVWDNINILNFPSGDAGGNFLVILFIIISIAMGVNRKGKSMIITAILFMTLFLILGQNIPIVLVVLTIMAGIMIGDDTIDNIGKMVN